MALSNIELQLRERAANDIYRYELFGPASGVSPEQYAQYTQMLGVQPKGPGSATGSVTSGLNAAAPQIGGGLSTVQAGAQPGGRSANVAAQHGGGVLSSGGLSSVQAGAQPASGLGASSGSLRNQILQQWGGAGDWNQGGIDRADELAQILAARGITDLGQLNFREQEWTPQGQISGGDSGDGTYSSPPVLKGLTAYAGDRRLGYLGDFNNDGTVKTFADSAEDPGWRGDHMAAAWSARGDGNVSFVPTKLGNGQIVMRPVWGSSRKETYDDIRGAAMVGAAALGGYYAGGGNAAAGLSGVDAAMVDLAASGGLTPASMGSAGLGAASGGMSGAELAAFMEANAGAMAPGAGWTGGAAASGGLGAAELGANGAFLGEGVASGVPAWDAAAIKSAVASGELGTAASYAGQTVAGGTGLQTLGKTLTPAVTSGPSTTGGSLFTTGGGASVPANGWDMLTKVGTSALAAGLGTAALNKPTDTSKYDPLFANLLAEQGKVSGRGDQQWNDYLSTFRPIEQKYAKTALEYDTPARREQAARAAQGEVATQFDIQRQGFNEDAMRYGVDPSTITAMGNASRLEEAKARAGAANNARDVVEQRGLGLLQGAAQFGRNMPSTSLQASGVATGTAGIAGSLANSQAQIQSQNTANRNATYGNLFQTGLGLWGMYTSSRKTKHVGERVDGRKAAEAIERSPANHWRYKGGLGDGSTQPRMGPMAEDLAREAPKVSNGKTVDGIAQLGLHHAAIGNLSKRIRKLEKAKDGVYEEVA